jgi:hypothetical protein
MKLRFRIAVGLGGLALVGAVIAAPIDAAGAVTTDSAAILPASVPAGCTTAAYFYPSAYSTTPAYRETSECGKSAPANYYIGRLTDTGGAGYDYFEGQYYNGSGGYWVDGSRGFVETRPSYGFLILLSTVIATTGVRTECLNGSVTATSAY